VVTINHPHPKTPKPQNPKTPKISKIELSNMVFYSRIIILIV
jgi:hypothetical protein